MRLVFVLSSLALMACHTGLDLPLGDADNNDCTQWTDAASCTSHGCATLDCANCRPTATFSSCYDPGEPAPMCVPHSCPPECVGVNEAGCLEDPNCFAVYQEAACDCGGTNCCPMVFDSCMLGPPVCDPGPTAQPCAPGPACETGYVLAYPSGGGCAIGCVKAPLCDAPDADCTAITTQASCDANPDCYSIISVPLCDCLGCCPPAFASCQNGPAQCTWGAPTPPSCAGDAVPCPAPYTLAYDSDGCPLGCVNEAQCSGPQS